MLYKNCQCNVGNFLLRYYTNAIKIKLTLFIFYVIIKHIYVVYFEKHTQILNYPLYTLLKGE